ATAGGDSGAHTLMDSPRFLRVPGVIKRIRAAALRYNSRFVEIAKLPIEQQIERIKELQEAGKDLPALVRLNLAASVKLATRFHGGQANLRCAAVMVALERYRRANKHWPGSLADLVPTYMAKVPLDPFNRSALHYRRLDNGVVIYSVGPDGQDDGGPFDPYPTITG